MGVVAAVAAVAGAGAAVAGTVQQKKASKQAASARRKSERTQQKIRDLQTARERRQLVRQSRTARAQAISGAAAGGVLDTSSLVTGVGGIQTQAASAISFLDTTQGLARQASIFNINAAEATGRAQAAGATAALGQSLFTAVDGFGAFEGLGPSSLKPSTPFTARVRPTSGG